MSDESPPRPSLRPHPTLRLTPDRLVYGLTTPSEARLSPDGRRVVYTLTTTDRATRRASSQLWLRDVDGASPRPLTASGDNNRAPCWSPDGRSIAFVSDRARRSGVFVLPVAEPGEAREVVRDPREIGDLAWSPDGRRVAYVIAVDPENPDEVEPPPGAAPRVRVTRRLDYKADGPGYLGERRRQVFVAEVEGGARRQVTDAAVDHALPQWSPDGRWLAAQVANRESQGSRLGLIEVESGQTRLVGAELGVVGVWAWSPAGDRVLFAGDSTITGQLDFFVYETSSGQLRRLTDDLACLPDAGRQGVAPAAPMVWLDDNAVLFHAFRAGASGLHVLDTATGRVEPVRAWPALRSGLSADAAGRRVVQTHVSLDGPAELSVLDRETGDERVITDYGAALLRESPAALWERFDVRRDPYTIEAFLLKPPDFDAGRRYPVILDVHGGPQSFYGYGFDPVQQMLATHGFLVVFCNPRGSTTYGREFTLQVRRDWGGEDYRDLMAVVDALLERPYAESTRLGIYGSSYGGYMAAWAIGQSDRFKAAVSRAPVFDLESFYGTSDIGYSWSESQFGGPPHENAEWYAAHSPSTYAHRATTPTLIIHGEADERCPIGQGEQMFVALRRAGCETELVRYPGGSHLFFRASGRPEHRVDFFERVLGWFVDHLGAAAG
jgi:dipeptidyl aminopeptidase/acylaminoacyl peptidase